MKPLAVVILLAALTTPALAGNDPPPASNELWGFYFSDFTLTASEPGPDYYVIGDMYIQPGVTMTIEPGVTLRFAANQDLLNSGDFFYDSEIICQGSIVAIGTPADSIGFVSQATTSQRGDWGHITFQGTGEGAFKFVKVLNATNGISSISSGQVTISHSSLREVSLAAINASGAEVTITNCFVSGTGGNGIYGGNSSMHVEHCVVTRAPGWGIEVRSGGSGDILKNRVFDCGGGIRCETGQYSIRSNRLEDLGLYGLHLEGTAPTPRTVEADTLLGTQQGIHLISSGPDTVRACIVRDGGGINISGNGAVIENAIVSNTGADGIAINGLGNTVRYTTIVGCITGVDQYGGSGNVLSNLIVTENASSGIRREGGLPLNVSYCNVWANGTDFLNESCSSVCYSRDPLFSDADYHLAAASLLRFLGENGTQIGAYGPSPGDLGNILIGAYVTDRTLTTASPGPDYYVLGDVTVGGSATLTIQPGVTLHFPPNTDAIGQGDYPSRSEILCDGALVAIGSSAQGIVFTSDGITKTRGDWGQIKFRNSGSGVLEFCEISYAMNGIHHNSSSSLSIANSSVLQCGSNGVWFDLGSGSVSECLIDGIGGLNSIGGFGVIIETGSSVVCERTVILNVEKQGVRCLNAASAVVRFNQIQNAGTEGIWSNGTNAKIHFNRVHGSGSYGIVLLSHSAPVAVIGDTVESSNTTHGIHVDGGQPDTIRTCLVRNLPYAHGIVVENTSGVQIENSMVHHVDTHGIYIDHAPATTITQCTVSNCRSGIFFNSAPSCSVKNTITVNNLWYGVEVVSNPASMNFVNSWNNASGQYLGSSCGTGCYGINPLFTDVDYHLASNSPLRVLGQGGTQMGRYGPDPGGVSGIGDHTGVEYPAGYLLPSAPNPFRSWTNISFLAREHGSGILTVYDINGRKVREEILEAIEGLNEIRVDRRSLGPGLYFYKVALPGFAEVGRMVIID